MRKFKNSKLGKIITAVFCVAVLSCTIVVYIGERVKIHGASMETILKDGDSVIIDKVSYRFTDPERYDIIIFPSKELQNEILIKRIIALPGEKIQIKNGHVYIDDKLLDSDTYSRELTNFAGSADEGFTLGADEYFCLGDNRQNSVDSRYDTVGCIKKSDIIGKAVFRVFPLKNFGTIK